MHKVNLSGHAAARLFSPQDAQSAGVSSAGVSKDAPDAEVSKSGQGAGAYPQNAQDAPDAGTSKDADTKASFSHEADAADRAASLEAMSARARLDVLLRLPPHLLGAYLPHLEDEICSQVCVSLPDELLVMALTAMESDDRVAVLAGLPPRRRAAMVTALPGEQQRRLRQSLSFPQGSAGRLMQYECVALPPSWSVGGAIDAFRQAENLPQDFYDVLLIDAHGRPVGSAPLNRIIRSTRATPLSTLMTTKVHAISAFAPQAEVARLFRRYDLTSAPVVDDHNRLLGVIMFDDVADVIDEESEDDLLKLSGVSESDFFHAAHHTAALRLPWLGINLLTAVIASAVIAGFQDTVAHLSLLAVLLPIVASMGGNAGMQTVSVAVRALAMGWVSRGRHRHFIVKELAVAALNALVFIFLAGLLTWLWAQDLRLGMVVGAAMAVTLLAAGCAGAVIPPLLPRLGCDPALASSVVITTITDMVAFFTLLFLAQLFIV